MAAGPLYLSVAAIQAFSRAGLDPTRHPVSLPSTGDLGWIQVTSFVVSGALVAAGAVGMRRAMSEVGAV